MIMTSSLVLDAPVTSAPTHLTLVAGVRRLNSRERDVLVLVADGYSTREVAKRLCYSERTIKNILQDITVRLVLRNRTQAVAVAIREGWI
jgi:DNA-binding NarL/FixJ family response regulator